MCACAAASLFWCRWWIFFFSSFSLEDIFLPLVDLDLKKSFSLLLPVKKGIKHSPEKKMKKRNRKKKSKFWNEIQDHRGSLGTLGIISTATVGARFFSTYSTWMGFYFYNFRLSNVFLFSSPFLEFIWFFFSPVFCFKVNLEFMWLAFLISNDIWESWRLLDFLLLVFTFSKRELDVIVALANWQSA